MKDRRVTAADLAVIGMLAAFMYAVVMIATHQTCPHTPQP